MQESLFRRPEDDYTDTRQSIDNVANVALGKRSRDYRDPTDPNPRGQPAAQQILTTVKYEQDNVPNQQTLPSQKFTKAYKNKRPREEALQSVGGRRKNQTDEEVKELVGDLKKQVHHNSSIFTMEQEKKAVNDLTGVDENSLYMRPATAVENQNTKALLEHQISGYQAATQQKMQKPPSQLGQLANKFAPPSHGTVMTGVYSGLEVKHADVPLNPHAAEKLATQRDQVGALVLPGKNLNETNEAAVVQNLDTAKNTLQKTLVGEAGRWATQELVSKVPFVGSAAAGPAGDFVRDLLNTYMIEAVEESYEQAKGDVPGIVKGSVTLAQAEDLTIKDFKAKALRNAKSALNSGLEFIKEHPGVVMAAAGAGLGATLIAGNRGALTERVDNTRPMIEGDPFVSDNRRIEATLEPSFHPTVAGIAKAEANERNAFGTIGTGAVNQGISQVDDSGMGLDSLADWGGYLAGGAAAAAGLMWSGFTTAVNSLYTTASPIVDYYMRGGFQDLFTLKKFFEQLNTRAIQFFYTEYDTTQSHVAYEEFLHLYKMSNEVFNNINNALLTASQSIEGRRVADVSVRLQRQYRYLMTDLDSRGAVKWVQSWWGAGKEKPKELIDGAKVAVQLTNELMEKLKELAKSYPRLVEAKLAPQEVKDYVGTLDSHKRWYDLSKWDI